MESVNFIKGYGKVNPTDDQTPPSSDHTKTTHKNQNQNRRLNLLISLSTLLVTLLIVGSTICALTHSKHEASSDPAPSSEPLKTVCAVTQHQDSCYTTISSLNTPPYDTNPVHFYNLSLQVTLQELTNLSSLPKSLISKSNDQNTEAALKDCVSLFDDALSEVNKSFDLMKSGPNKKVLSEMEISDMQTWISAAMSDQETCLDGLEEMGSTLVDEFRMKVQKSKEYMSNSLAILNNLQTLLQKFGLTKH